MNFISDLKNIDQQCVRNGSQLNLSLDIQGHGKLTCTQALRSIPGKRLTCLGYLDTRKVVVKLFYGSPWSRAKWFRCYRNALTLYSKAIPTAVILYAEKIKHNLFVIIFEFIEDATRADMVLQETYSREEKKHTVSLLIWNIADQHKKGIFQRDLHLGNFLLKDETIYSIDTDKVILSTFFRLFKTFSLFSLSNLILSIMKYEQNVLDLAVEGYCTTRKWKIRPEYKKSINKKIQRKRKKDVKKFVRKIYQNKDPFKAFKRNGLFCLYDQRQFNNNSFFLKISRSLRHFSLIADNLCWLKTCKCHVNTFNILDLHFREEPLFTAWKNIAILNRVGIYTPVQFLYLRKKIKFNFYKSLIVTKPVNGLTLDLFMESKNYTEEKKTEINTRIQERILKLKSFNFKLDLINSEDWIINYPNIIFNYLKRVEKMNHSVHEIKPEELKGLF